MANALRRLKFKDPFPVFAAVLKAVKLLGGDPAGDEITKDRTLEAMPASNSMRM